MAFGGGTSGNRNRAYGSPMSRRGLLQTGALCLVGLVSPAGCGGQTPERGGGQKSAVREPQALGASGAEGEKVEVRVDGGAAPGVLDAAQGATAAVVMVGGMAGGIEGPSGIYPKLAKRFRDNGITTLRLDYREPGDLSSCTDDLLAAVGALGRGGTKKVVLIGWSFGGAVAIGAGVASELVVGVATVASATQGTEDIGKLSPEKSLLLIHGTRDTSVVPSLARYLYRKAGEPKELVFYEGDGHDIEIHTEVMLRKIYTWSTKLLANSASGALGRRLPPLRARRLLSFG
jgi:alpha/beta superfamily hydrolase